jgi:acyl-CoA thioesterase YciA
MNDTSDRRYLAIKSLMSPRHTHSHGMILDSVVLSYIDEAGAVGARHESRRSGWPDQPMVAIDFKNVESHQAVFVGDLLSFYTRVMAVDRTSITVHVTVETDREGKVEQIADAEVTYETLKLEEQGRQPVPIRGEC